MNKILWTERWLWTAVALLVWILASPRAVLGQIPDVTESQKAQPVSDGQTESMFKHEVGKFWISGQINFIFQTHPPFDAKYTGPNSLQPDYEKATSRVLTLYTGYKFNNLTEALVDIEETGGQGLSTALGVAGFPNLDVVRNPTLSQSP